MNSPADKPLNPDKADNIAAPVNDDIACVGCGYNLRGLDVARTCPECGMPVDRSIRGDLLRDSDPAWVEELSSGLRWLAVCVLTGWMMNLPLYYVNQFQPEYGLLTVGMIGIPASLGLIACLHFTAAEPRSFEVESPYSHRRIARTCAVVMALMLIVATGLEVLKTPGRHLLISLGALVAAVGIYFVGRYAETLALRIRDTGLAATTRVATNGWTAIGISVFIGAFILVLDYGPSGVMMLDVRAFGCLFLAGALLTGIAFLIFTVIALVLWFRFYAALRRAARDAHEAWSAE